MNLRLKTILTVSLGVCLLMLAVYGLLSARTITAALELEQRDLNRNLTRAKNAVMTELTQLEMTTLDWGVFDEAYNYVENKNPNFAATNLVSNLSILNLEYFIIERGNRILLSRKRTDNQRYESPSEPLGSFLASDKWLWHKFDQPLPNYSQIEVKSGLLARNGNIYFVAQAPIVPSSSIKPAVGRLTMVRLFNLETLKKLSELTQVEIKVFQKLPTQFEMLKLSTALQQLLAGTPNVFLPLDQKQITGLTLLSPNTTFGALVLEVTTERTTYQTALEYLQRLAWSLLLIGVLVTVLIIALLEFGIISRLSGLHAELDKIALFGDVSHRVRIRGRDEIGKLAQQINTSLTRVEETQVKAVQLEARLERLRSTELEANLEATRLELFERLARVAEFRDNETSLHTSRVGEISAAIGLQLGLASEETERLRYAARLHDIGKIAIPDSILFKPSGLDREEWSLMQTHAALGAQMLEGSGSPLLEMARVIALTHHERWNGGLGLSARAAEHRNTVGWAHCCRRRFARCPDQPTSL